MQKITIVGETNVGKSTLFNRLIGKHQAVTAFEQGTTRDPIFGVCDFNNKSYLLCDTAGMLDKTTNKIETEIQNRLTETLKDTDLFLLIVNGRISPNKLNIKIAQLLLKINKPILLILNKIDDPRTKIDIKWKNWLIKNPIEISASNGRNITQLFETIEKTLPEATKKLNNNPKIVVFGRPNVGKSTLINSLLSEDKVLTSNIPGTTRDVLNFNHEINDLSISLIDTPGIRKRGKIKVGVEKFGFEHAIDAVRESRLVLVVVDACEGATRQDVHLTQIAHELKKQILIVFNKVDILERKMVQRFAYLDKFPQILVSAKEKINLDELNKLIIQYLNK